MGTLGPSRHGRTRLGPSGLNLSQKGVLSFQGTTGSWSQSSAPSPPPVTGNSSNQPRSQRSLPVIHCGCPTFRLTPA